MKAVCWWGKGEVRVVDVPDPKIINPHDAIVRVTLTAICGSDLHLYDGYVPTMMRGDILGHEFMGEVVETGAAVKNLKVGDRVVVPFPISCGRCWFCQNHQWSLCDNTNPNAWMNEALNGFATAGIYGYSHMYGGYAGGQAQYVRVPFADVNPFKVPNGIPDEKVLFLTDIFPTGYQAAEQCGIQPGDTVAVWGCGPVGLFAIRSAWMLGAERVIAIDRFRERLDLAAGDGRTETLDYSDEDTFDELKDLTGGRGPDRCIDAVGMEAHGTFADAMLDRVKQAMKLQFDRAHVLRQAIHSCRKGGTVSIPGVYAGFIDKVPMGMAFAKGLTMRMGQTHVHNYQRPLFERIERGDIDPSFIITHRVTLDDAPEMYQTFRDKQDDCVKVVMRPS
ncbi:MAG TPA: zinc-dependent alcohol dehydrogenase [Thermoanaerobaculia bacterium]|nr:zinc-dependent alcohol dehydrogenase [Thermoanaerobaculia bacterium]